MGSPEFGPQRLWPTITDEETAARAARVGAVIAYLSAVAAAILSIVAWIRGPIGNIDGWSILDAALAALIGWGVWRLSRAWALVGLGLCVTNISLRLADSDVGVIALIILLGAVNGVRGTFAYHRFRGALTESSPSA